MRAALIAQYGPGTRKRQNARIDILAEGGAAKILGTTGTCNVKGRRRQYGPRE